jgi:hypothetical protein
MSYDGFRVLMTIVPTIRVTVWPMLNISKQYLVIGYSDISVIARFMFYSQLFTKYCGALA